MYLTSIVFLYKVDHIIPLLMKESHWDQLLSSLMNSFFFVKKSLLQHVCVAQYDELYGFITSLVIYLQIMNIY